MDVNWALRALELDPVPGTSLDESRSTAGVSLVTVGGAAAVVKVTRSDGTPASLDEARRELAFYLRLAPGLPIRTPRLLRHLSTDSAVVLLLSAHGRTGPTRQWVDADWLRVAQDLAALHNAPVPPEPEWHRGSMLLERLGQPVAGDVRRFWSAPGELELLRPIFDDLPALGRAITAPAPCLSHGDCHAANLVREHGSVVWVDWQSVGVGSPAGDLVFPSVRGVPDGMCLPQAGMITTYCALRGLDESMISTAVVAAELAMFLLVWPEYASYNTATGVDRVRRRVRELVHAWTQLRRARPGASRR